MPIYYLLANIKRGIMEMKAFLVIDSYKHRYLVEGTDKIDAFERARKQLGIGNPITFCEELTKDELLVYCAA